jgi:hypothetical protein
LHELRLDTAAERIAHLYPRLVRNAEPYSNSDSHSNCYHIGHTQAHTDAKAFTNPEISAHSATAPVASIDEKETHCSIRFLSFTECDHTIRVSASATKSLDIFDVFRVKENCAPVRKQGESER